MIDDSWEWKDELRRDLRSLRRKLSRARLSEQASEEAIVAVEKFALVAAYIIRKLKEAGKLSDELEAEATLPVQAFPRADTSYPVDLMSRHNIDRAYDLRFASHRKLSLDAACNRLIHSFVFTVALEAETPCGFLFNSDRMKEREVYLVTLDDFLSLVRSVLADDVVSSEFSRITGVHRKSRGELPTRSGGPLA